MKLLRYGPLGSEKPALLDPEGHIRSLESIIPDILGEHLSPASLARLAKLDIHTLPVVDPAFRIGACIGKTGKFLCVGLNYKDHAKEIGIAPPDEPILFSKATSAICGPYDNIILPRGSEKTDWEVELGVVIGSPAKYVSVENAMNYVAGFCVINDLSERAFQLEGTGQWTKGKSCDTFGPMGPWLVTKDEVADPQQLELWLEVDGHRYQQGNTSDMVFKVDFLVSYLSHFFTLYPGDVISTGTPCGAGFGQKPHPVYLKPGQIVNSSITHLGQQKQRVVADR